MALELNVTRKPFSFLGQQPLDVDDGNSQQWGGFPRLKRTGPWHERLMDYTGEAAPGARVTEHTRVPLLPTVSRCILWRLAVSRCILWRLAVSRGTVVDPVLLAACS